MVGAFTAALVLTGCAAGSPSAVDSPGLGSPAATAPAGGPSPSVPAPPGAGSVDAAPLAWTRRWVVVELEDADGIVRNPTPVPTLDLLDPTRVRGWDGCNSFSGRLVTTGSPAGAAAPSREPGVDIAVTELVSTERACTATNGIESRYLRILKDADRLTVVGSRLVLRAGGANLILDLDRMLTVQPVQPDGR